MPIKREHRQHYNRAWQRLSARLIAERAENKCEWCSARNLELHPRFRYTVRLATCHINQQAGDNREENLLVLCQSCHLRLDRIPHVEHARATRQRKKDEARPLLVEYFDDS